MTRYAYLFEAHSIQRYILDSGRLAEMVGASELVESLTEKKNGGLLHQALSALRISESIMFSRHAGGAITAFFTNLDEALKFRDLWGLLVEQYAPGLSYSHVVAEGTDAADAVSEGRKALRIRKQRPSVVHPEASPIVRRAPRTGLPATNTGTDVDDESSTKNLKEWVDRASHIKSAKRFRKSLTLHNKLKTPDGMQWPTQFEPDEEDTDAIQFPFLPGNRYIGIVHADGNDLGQLVHGLEEEIKLQAPDEYPDLFLQLSKAIEVARLSRTHYLK